MSAKVDTKGTSGRCHGLPWEQLDTVWAVSRGHRRPPQSSGTAPRTCAWDRESRQWKRMQARVWLEGGSSVKQPFRSLRKPFSGPATLFALLPLPRTPHWVWGLSPRLLTSQSSCEHMTCDLHRRRAVPRGRHSGERAADSSSIAVCATCSAPHTVSSVRTTSASRWRAQTGARGSAQDCGRADGSVTGDSNGCLFWNTAVPKR